MEEVIIDADKSSGTTFVCAKDLRDKENLQKIPGDKPGWYRWWATEKALEQLLIPQKYFERLHKRKHADKYLFCIYVGIAVKESIRARLNWHVNQHHTESAVQSGTLSTLRQSISSLVAGDQRNETAANELIDQLTVEYCAMDYPIKSDIAKNEIERIEQNELSKYIYPLNIQGNKNAEIKEYLLELRKKRKSSKTFKTA